MKLRGRKYEFAILRATGAGPAEGMLVWMGGAIKIGRRFITIMPIAPTLKPIGVMYRIPWHRVYEIVTYDSAEKFIEAYLANYQEGLPPAKIDKAVGYG